MLEHQRYTRSARGAPSRDSREAVFDYFAGEIFAHATPENQRTLLMSSFLPRVTARLAVALTGDPNAERLLEDLTRRHLFTNRTGEAETTYQYHGLFRAFLRSRAMEQFPSAERAGITQRASRLFEEDGQIEDAIALNLQWGHHDGAAELILRHATTIFEQGRRGLLVDWIGALPAPVLHDHPWLWYWLGLSQMFEDPASGRRSLETAYDSFLAFRDVTGQMLCAGAMTRACIHDITWVGVDRWLSALEPLLAMPCDDELPPRVLLIGLTRAVYAALVRQPQHPRLPEWADRAMTILGADLDPNEIAMAGFSLMTYFNWVGNTAAQERIIGWVQPLLAESKLSAVSVTYWSWAHASYLLRVRASDESLTVLDRGIDTAATHGLFIGAVLRQYRIGFCLSLGRSDEAAAMVAQLDDVSRPPPRVEPYNEMKAWLALARGDLVQATAATQAALQLAADRGRRYYEVLDLFLLAEILVETGAFEQAREAIAEYRRRTVGVAGALPEYQATIAEAYLALCCGEIETCRTLLRTALAVGRRERIVNHWTWFPRMMSRLYAEALEHGIEADYVRDVIRRRGLIPESPSVVNWPWPLRIRTLGAFEVIRDDAPLVFEGKAQRKPMELLKALIALGGRNVSADSVIGMLWPLPSDGDSQKAFEITVHRLRKLLGSADSIRVTDRRATLNAQLVFVDLWALEHALASCCRSRQCAAARYPVARASRVSGARAPPGAVPCRRGRCTLVHGSSQPHAGTIRALRPSPGSPLGIATAMAARIGSLRTRHRARSPGRDFLRASHGVPPRAEPSSRGNGAVPSMPPDALGRAEHQAFRGNRSDLCANLG